MTPTAKIRMGLGLFALVIFAAGLWQLFSIRFASGDVYPPYSSLRADPLGARALHDAFDALASIRTGRLYEPLDRLENLHATTVLWIGDEPNVQPEPGWHDFVYGGGRLVVGWDPTQFVESSATTNTSGNLPWQQARYRKGPLIPEDPKSLTPRELEFRTDWKLDITFIGLHSLNEGVRSEAATLVPELPLPERIAWHSTVCFTNLGPDWTTLYERRSHPVAIERKFGRGSVVILTNSWPFSNEAVRTDRHSDLLLWLTGGRGRVLFDERHLGVENSQGIAGLMRHYRLHGLVLALGFVAVLFLWRSMSSFLPRATADATGATAEIQGHDLATGYVNLLRRGIPKKQILDVCFKEWKESQVVGATVSAERMQKMEQALLVREETREDAAATYHRLNRIWKEKKL